MSQGKTYTFQRQGLENTIISVVRGQGKSGNFFSKTCIHPGLLNILFAGLSFIMSQYRNVITSLDYAIKSDQIE